MNKFLRVTLLVILLSPFQYQVNLSFMENSSGQATTVYVEPYSVKVNLKFWGYTDTSSIVEDIPTFYKDIQYSYLRENNSKPEWFVKSINNQLWSWESQVSYKISMVTPQKQNQLILNLKNGEVITNNDTSQMNINGNITDVEGKKIYITSLSQYIQDIGEADENSDYTIHIMNFTNIESEMFPNHWLSQSFKKNYYNSSSDFRNFAVINNRNLIFDPTAINPVYNGESDPLFTINDLATSKEKTNYLESKLKQIVDSIIVGSPYHRPYTIFDFASPKHFFSQIIITNSSNQGINEGVLNNQQDLDRFLPSSISNLMSFLNSKYFDEPLISTKTSIIDVQQTPKLIEFFTQNVKVINGQKYLIITDQIAEDLKGLMRNTDLGLFNTFPEGFFYLTLTIAIDPDLKIVFQENSGKLRPYAADVIGLAITNLDTWMKTISQTQESISYTNNLLHAFGQNLGLPRYDHDIDIFYPSVMSTYMINSEKGLTFRSSENFNLIKKYAMIMNVTVKSTLSSYRNEIENKYNYLPHKILDDPESIRVNATYAYQSGDYNLAISLYLKSIQRLNEVLKTMNSRIASIGNSVYLIVTLLFLYSLSSFLISYVEKSDDKLNAKGLPVSWYPKKK